MAFGKAVTAALLALVVLSAPSGAAVAAPEGAGVDLEAVAARLAEAKTQEGALRDLGDSADPALEPLIRALKDGALYRFQGRLVILGDDGGLRDVHWQPVAGELASGQEAIGLDEKLFGVVQRLLERFEVLSPNAAIRRAAAIRLGNSGDPAAVALLTRAREREKDAAIRALLDEGLAKLQLWSPDPTARATAVRYLGALKSEAALAQLRAMQTTEADAGVRQAIKQAVDGIESHIGIRNIVGYVFNGISLGAVLLIMSLGLAVTFGLMGIINMAHGEMLMLGSYTAYVVQEFVTRHWAAHQDYYFFAALPLSFLVAGLVGLGLELGVIRFLYGRPLETLIVTWGIGMIFQQGARLYFGDQTSVNSPTWFRGGIEPMAGLIFPWNRIFIVALALAALGALWLLLNHTWAGLRVQAVMQNRGMAACLGVSTRRVDAVTFALGTALAGVAGCALALIGTVDPEVGKTYIVDSFMVVVLGGVGKLVGTVVASFGIGVANKLLEPAIGGTAAAVYAKVFVLLIVILFLQSRPTGLFPQRGRAAEAASEAA